MLTIGCEGIVSKRLGSPYPLGPIGRLDQSHEPGRASVKRVAQQDWGGTRTADDRTSPVPAALQR
jgi:hypothetical protein